MHNPVNILHGISLHNLVNTLHNLHSKHLAANHCSKTSPAPLCLSQHALPRRPSSGRHVREARPLLPCSCGPSALRSAIRRCGCGPRPPHGLTTLRPAGISLAPRTSPRSKCAASHALPRRPSSGRHVREARPLLSCSCGPFSLRSAIRRCGCGPRLRTAFRRRARLLLRTPRPQGSPSARHTP